MNNRFGSHALPDVQHIGSSMHAVGSAGSSGKKSSTGSIEDNLGSTFLTIGSSVSLFAIEARGFIEGCHDGEALVDTSIAAEKGDGAAAADPQELRPRGDFSRCVFEVLTRRVYAHHLRAEASLRDHGRSDQAAKLDDAHRERRVNAAEQANACGKRVRYGDVIQLAQRAGRPADQPHADQHMCLALQRDASSTPLGEGPECGKVVLSQTACEYCWLRVLPALRTASIGEPVRLCDPLWLRGASSGLWLHADKHAARQSGASIFVNGHPYHGTSLRLLPFRTDAEERMASYATAVLRGGDAIMLRAREVEGAPFLQTDAESMCVADYVGGADGDERDEAAHADEAGAATDADDDDEAAGGDGSDTADESDASSAEEDVGDGPSWHSGRAEPTATLLHTAGRSRLGSHGNVLRRGGDGAPRCARFPVYLQPPTKAAPEGAVSALATSTGVVGAAGTAGAAGAGAAAQDRESNAANAAALWRVEEVSSNGVRGSLLHRGSHVRLLHLATGHYLQVREAVLPPARAEERAEAEERDEFAEFRENAKARIEEKVKEVQQNVQKVQAAPREHTRPSLPRAPPTAHPLHRAERAVCGGRAPTPLQVQQAIEDTRVQVTSSLISSLISSLMAPS